MMSTSLRPPRPVAVAAVLTAVVAVALLAFGVSLLASGGPAGWVLLLFAAVAGALGYGLWRGNRGALIVGSLVAGAVLLLGLRGLPVADEPAEFVFVLVQVAGAGAVLALLLGPASSRAHFRH